MAANLCMKFFLVCVVWIVTDGASTTEITGLVGGGVQIRCEYDERYGNNTKYFCQGAPPGCVELIRTDVKQKLVTQGRYSLLDSGTDFFLVDVVQLWTEDEGIYQCAVAKPLAVDAYTEVYVHVNEGQSTISSALETTEPIYTTTLPLGPSAISLDLETTETVHAETHPQVRLSTISSVLEETTSIEDSDGHSPDMLYQDFAARSSMVNPPSIAPEPAGPKEGSDGHSPGMLYHVLAAIIGLLVVLIVAILILIMVFCVKRTKSADLMNLPASMETASVGP